MLIGRVQAGEKACDSPDHVRYMLFRIVYTRGYEVFNLYCLVLFGYCLVRYSCQCLGGL